MKLRIDGNEIRLRLSPDDVATLARTGTVEARLRFAPDAELRYRLEASDVSCIGARFGDDAVTVDVPRALVEGWSDDDRVGFEEAQPTGTGEPLRILIEKDFHCLHRDEPAGSRFPNPGA
ncbi:MAG TPA: hypothetical protein VF190_04280 [Rhodothermales bacterium]